MYSNWRIRELKEELRKRGASLRGKKADLVERLELYDQHFNFGLSEGVEDDDPKMELPSGETYRDINSNTVLPPIDKTALRHYLNYTQKKSSMVNKLYESRHLLTARSSIVGEYTFVKGHCRKTMKNLQYEVNLKLNKDGNPVESQCECPAGSGINATCKHVGVLLFGIENMVREKFILLHEVCTQKLQQFHIPKQIYSGTPVHAEKMIKLKKKVIFEPYPLKYLNKENYNTRIRNLIIGFPNSHMPLKQLYEPANPYALTNDHDYISVGPKEELLKRLKLLEITSEEINEIQNLTIGQLDCSYWHEYRKKRITASNFHTICHLKDATMMKYANELLNKRQFTTRATTHGILNEKIALQKYATEYDLLVEPCGIFISKERPHLAASPDGVLGEETVIEVKCPYASRNQEINITTVPYLEKCNGILSLKKNCPYYYQIQGQLYCSGRTYCNLIIYTYKDIKVIYVEKDNYFINNMLNKLDNFYNNVFKKALCEKYLYYNYTNFSK